MNFYAPFCLPFIVGAIFMFAVIAIKYTTWLLRLSSSDKRLIIKGIPTRATLRSICEIVNEALLHRRIWRTNPVLGYMHMSLAFGWFLLIAVGWIETVIYLGFEYVPLQGHVFFKYFATGLPHMPVLDFLMDLLLLFVLSGVALALSKRLRSSAMGMRRTTKHVLPDRIALTALWFIFPARLVAESITVTVHGGGSFLTQGVGSLLESMTSLQTLASIENGAWWLYSICLGLFFISMPFSRYMHIFTEIPLIFLRNYSLRSTEKASSFDEFQIAACSRCGICIDPCQLQSDLGINDVQSVYFLRDRRYKMLELATANNCLMCGRCTAKCPVGIDLDILRLNSRDKMRNVPNEKRFEYFSGIDRSAGRGKVGFFAGCMTKLTPNTLISMEEIFTAAQEDVWWADRNGGVCCGRPLKLSGEVDASKKMVRHNVELFKKHKITTLVTSCPICLRVFREEYDLGSIEVLHHSEYIDRLLAQGRISLNQSQKISYTYHDPCELGRGCKIYEEPRNVIRSMGTLIEPAQSRQNALCCGSSLANTAINDRQQIDIARSVGAELQSTGADVLVTACPLCKKGIGRGVSTPIKDLSEIVAENIKSQQACS